jgi:SAM-dependent methyltransferase
MSVTASKNTAEELPPQLLLFQMVTGHYLSQALYVVATLGVADLLVDGPKGHEEIAKATNTHAPSLLRLLRYLASAGVFSEDADGRFGLTPVGQWLRSDIPASRRAVAQMFAGPMQQKVWGELMYAVRTGKLSFEHAFGMDAFRYFGQHPEEAALFNQAMTSSTTQTAQAVAAGYDFSSFRTLVDVGGGHGVLLITILKANPGLRGILFELPFVADGARKAIAAAGLADRCDVVAGDFFDSMPEGGDAYVMKSVIHDWDDAKSVRILENCRRVMPAGGTLLLVEGVLPARMERSPINQIFAGSDVNMMLNVGGRERTDAEFRALFEAAGFGLQRIVATQSLMCVLEGEKRV